MRKHHKILIIAIFNVILLLGFAVPVNMVGNWYQQFLPNLGSQQINDIFFIDSLNGYAVASRNVNPDTASILKTTNGGDNWQIIFTQTPKRFIRIKFINHDTGFACGGTGGGTPQLYKTTNAGSSWSLQGSFGCAYWSDMHVLSNDTIWLVDSDGLCGGAYRTTNGGVNWQQRFYNMNNNPTKIYFYNSRLGFISTNSNTVLRRTSDGGANWSIISGQDGFTDMKFADSLTGYKCRGFVKKTTDGGLNWQQQTLPTGGNLIGSGMSKISYVSQTGDTLWGLSGEIIIGSGTRGILYHTINGGNNWLFQIPDTSIHINYYYHGTFVSRKFGWNYNTNTGIHTTNGGDTTFISPIKQINSNIPKEFKLFQNYPNPFNPNTVISYQLTFISSVKLVVFDITGKEIITLVNQKQTPGIYETDFSGTGLSSGVYFYKLTVIAEEQAGGRREVYTDTKRMVLIK